MAVKVQTVMSRQLCQTISDYDANTDRCRCHVALRWHLNKSSGGYNPSALSAGHILEIRERDIIGI